MPRGRRKIVIEDTIEAAISAKQEEKESVVAEIASAQAAIAEAKATLKSKRAELKKIDLMLTRLEEQKAAEDIAKAEAEKKAKAMDTVQKLMDKGFGIDDILKLLEE